MATSYFRRMRGSASYVADLSDLPILDEEMSPATGMPDAGADRDESCIVDGDLVVAESHYLATAGAAHHPPGVPDSHVPMGSSGPDLELSDVFGLGYSEGFFVWFIHYACLTFGGLGADVSMRKAPLLASTRSL